MASTVKCHSLGVFKHDLSLLFLLYINIHKLFKMKTKIYAFSTGSRKTDMHLTTVGQKHPSRTVLL